MLAPGCQSPAGSGRTSVTTYSKWSTVVRGVQVNLTSQVPCPAYVEVIDKERTGPSAASAVAEVAITRLAAVRTVATSRRMGPVSFGGCVRSGVPER